MAGRGPLPKTHHQRPRNDRRVASQASALVPDDVVRGDPLVGPYLQQTLDWWETWRRSAQAQLFTPTDWQALRIGAELVERFYRAPNAAAATEVRLLGERFGATYVDRQRARIVIEGDRGSGGEASLAAVTPLRSRESALARLRGAAPYGEEEER